MKFFQILESRDELRRCSQIVEDIGVKVADPNKVWDITNVTAAFKELQIKKDAKVIDLGAYNDSSLWSLHSMGYKNLYGVDINKDIYNQPFYNTIRYLYANIEDTHFPPRFFDAAICLSVLEHNVDLDHFFREASRILKPQAHLIVTVDFYPEKLETHRSKWNIFSSFELIEMIKLAKRHGFVPLFPENDLLAVPHAKHSPIEFLGLNYTFAFFCLVKNANDNGQEMPRQLSILSYSNSQGGISEYTRHLQDRLTKETGLKVEIISDAADAISDLVLVEYAAGIRPADQLLNDVRSLRAQGKKVVIEIHDSLTRLTLSQRKELEATATLMYRANEIALFDKLQKYYLFPHISYANVPLEPFRDCNEIYLASFGFGINAKRLGEVVSLVKKLNVPAKLLISKNDEYGPGNKQFSGLLSQLKNDHCVTVIENEKQANDHGSSKIIVKTGFFSIEEIEEELKECSHLVFAHRSFYSNSGTMSLAKRLSKPIVAIDSFQARQAQAIRAKIFSSRLKMLKEDVVLSAAVFLRKIGVKPNFVAKEIATDPRAWYSDIIEFIRAKPPTLEFFKKSSHLLSRDEDGLLYLTSVLENIKTDPSNLYDNLEDKEEYMSVAPHAHHI